MKKTPPSSPPPPDRFWRTFAVCSLVANFALGVWTWRASLHPAAIPAAPPAIVPVVAAPSAAATVVRSRELGPYAALGSFMAENNRIADLKWTEPQFSAFLAGFRSSYEGRGVPLDDDAKRLQQQISERVQAMLAAERPDPVEDYFRALREKEGVSRTASGLHYRVTEPGFGPNAKATDTVVISFAARLPDGQSLPTLSRTRTRTAVQDLLPGLAEGVQLLRVGGKGLVYLPPALAFSEQNWPPQLPKDVPLAFFVELHEIEPAK